MAAIVRIISVAILLVGCGGRNEFVGTWRGERDVKAGAGGDPAILRTLSRVDLTVKPNGSFEMIDAGMPKMGSVRYEGSKAFLLVDTILNRPLTPSAQEMNAEIELQVQPDGTLLLNDPKGFDEKPIRLRPRAKS